MTSKAYTSQDMEYIEKTVRAYMPQKEFPEVIYDSVEYCLFGGGKRVRPLLMLMVSNMTDGEKRFTEPLMAAVEMIHTYSLIHDDLPCMDNDDYRRGRESCHKKYGETLGVLTGDALLNLAYETMLKGFGAVNNSANYLKAVRLLADAAGINGMVGGQVADSVETGAACDDALLAYVHSRKTGALLRASVLCGGLSGDISDEKYNNLDTFGSAIGLIFQITDDILDLDDMTESEKMKLTYPSFYGLEESRRKVDELRDICLKCLDIFGAKSEPLKIMTVDLCKRSK